MFDALQSCKGNCILSTQFLLYYNRFSYLIGISDRRAVFCESGATIERVYKKIVDSHYLFTSSSKTVIVNLGAFDILLNRDLTDIQAEYKRLISAMKEIGLIPIITTLPMIKMKDQHPNKKQIKQAVLLFNAFLHDTYHADHFIDLWQFFHKRENDLCQV